MVNCAFLSKMGKSLFHVIEEHALGLGSHVGSGQYTYNAGAALKDVPNIELGNSATQAYGFAPGEEEIAEVFLGAHSTVFKQAMPHGKISIRYMSACVHHIVDRRQAPPSASSMEKFLACASPLHKMKLTRTMRKNCLKSMSGTEDTLATMPASCS